MLVSEHICELDLTPVNFFPNPLNYLHIKSFECKIFSQVGIKYVGTLLKKQNSFKIWMKCIGLILSEAIML